MKKVKNGFEVFDKKHKRFGGHWQKLSKIVGLDYLTIYFGWWEEIRRIEPFGPFLERCVFVTKTESLLEEDA